MSIHLYELVMLTLILLFPQTYAVPNLFQHLKFFIGLRWDKVATGFFIKICMALVKSDEVVEVIKI